MGYLPCVGQMQGHTVKRGQSCRLFAGGTGETLDPTLAGLGEGACWLEGQHQLRPSGGARSWHNGWLSCQQGKPPGLQLHVDWHFQLNTRPSDMRKTLLFVWGQVQKKQHVYYSLGTCACGLLGCTVFPASFVTHTYFGCQGLGLVEGTWSSHGNHPPCQPHGAVRQGGRQRSQGQSRLPWGARRGHQTRLGGTREDGWVECLHGQGEPPD